MFHVDFNSCIDSIDVSDEKFIATTWIGTLDTEWDTNVMRVIVK